jgi:Na+/H+-dicarboxylate symporter
MPHPLELVHPRNLKHLTHHLQALIRDKLWAKIIIGLIAGVAIGVLFGPEMGLVSRETANVVGNWFALPGKIFLALIQMIVIPLVVASVIRGIAATGSVDQLKKVGARLVMYFLLTTVVAVTIGVGVAQAIQPGQFIDNPPKAEAVSTSEVQNELAGEEEGGFSLAAIPESIVSIIPQNPLNEAVQMNMLSVVLFSIVLGLALVSLEATKSKPLLDLLGSLQSVSMTVVRWTMYLAPFAVFGLIAQLLIDTGFASLFGVGIYVLTVLAGLGCLLSFYLAVAFVVAGIPPWRFLAAVREVQLLAFSTGSSVAVMPLSIKTVEEKINVRPSISQFVIPVGATVNMDATAMFQAAATIFLVQVYGLDLSFGMLALLLATIIGSSIGTPATPGVGIIILSVVLKSVGVPIEGVALIIGVDRILEMLRTAVNVSGDITASTVMNRIVPMPQSYEQEIETQKRIEDAQLESGEDVVTGEFEPSPIGRTFGAVKDAFSAANEWVDEHTSFGDGGNTKRTSET